MTQTMVYFNKRNEERTDLSGMTARIAVKGGAAVCGTVRDLSMYGVSISDVAREEMVASNRYSITISGYGYSIILQARPRWVRGSGCGRYLVIGFYVSHPPLMWKLFFKRLQTSDEQETTGEVPYHEVDKLKRQTV